MEVQDILIENIVQLDNSRNSIKKKELEDLMESIKSNGLLQPIGLRPSSEYEDVWEINFGNRRFQAFKKLGKKTIPAVLLEEAEVEADVLVTNLIENEHRLDISDIEKGRYFQELISDKHGLTVGEVAIRIGISRIKVQQCLRLHLEIPEEFRTKVRTNPNGVNNNKAGTIPVTQADLVLVQAKRAHFTSKQRDELLNYCREDHVTKEHLSATMKLMSAGASFSKAKKKCDDVKMISITVPVIKEDWEEYLEIYKTGDQIRIAMCKVLYGEDDNELQFQRPY